MTDHLSKEKRSWNMSRIRSKNTKPELTVRQYLFSRGMRYRLHSSRLPGKPDISNQRRKIAVFVNGCFWHHHDGCRRATIPKSNTEYWIPKLEKNAASVEKNIQELKSNGWQVYTVWECEAKDTNKLDKIFKGITAVYG